MMKETFNKLKQNWIPVIIVLVSIATVKWLIFYNQREIYLYAWERPEDFSFLDKDSYTTIVFYAGDVVIKNNKAVFNLRRNQLIIPEGIKHFPLVRIDSFDSPDALVKNEAEIASFVINICGLYKECQIDFEARTSEYNFYINLMNKVRAVLPNNKISATALASWCSSPSFIDNLSADIAVPMFYRMGRDAFKIKSGEVGSWFLSNSKCSDTIALSVDELDFNPRRYMRGKSVYLFNPDPWTRDSYKKTLSHLGL